MGREGSDGAACGEDFTDGYGVDGGAVGAVCAEDEVKRIFISGPMTGYPEDNFPAFFSAQARLEADGWTVINPARHGRLSSRLPYAAVMALDIADIRALNPETDAVYLLLGWAESPGAWREYLVARDCGLSFLHEALYPRMIYARKGNP